MVTLHYQGISLVNQITAAPSTCMVQLSQSQMTPCWPYIRNGTQLVLEVMDEESFWQPRISTMVNATRSTKALSPKHADLSFPQPLKQLLRSLTPSYGVRMTLRSPQMHRLVNHTPSTGCGTGPLPHTWIRPFQPASQSCIPRAWILISLQRMHRRTLRVRITFKVKT